MQSGTVVTEMPSKFWLDDKPNNLLVLVFCVSMAIVGPLFMVGASVEAKTNFDEGFLSSHLEILTIFVSKY